MSSARSNAFTSLKTFSMLFWKYCWSDLRWVSFSICQSEHTLPFYGQGLALKSCADCGRGWNIESNCHLQCLMSVLGRAESKHGQVCAAHHLMCTVNGDNTHNYSMALKYPRGNSCMILTYVLQRCGACKWSVHVACLKLDRRICLKLAFSNLPSYLYIVGRFSG